MRVFIVIFTLLAITGCNATGPKFEQVELPSNKLAKVSLYRPWAMMDGSASPTIQINGVDSFNIKNGGYKVLELQPGLNTITVKKGNPFYWRAKEMTVKEELKASEVYFLRLTAAVGSTAFIGSTPVVSGNYSFGYVDKETALKELQETKQN